MFTFNIFFWLLSQVKVAKDGRYYVVASRKAHFLKKEVITVTGESKAKMGKTIAFLKAHPQFGEVRVVTNMPFQSETARYMISTKETMPEQGLMAINGGDWQPYLLIKRLEEKSISFRLTVVKNGVINFGPQATAAERKKFFATWKEKVGKVQFAWANASTSFFLELPDQQDWGLDLMGIEMIDAPKSSKRANELVRTSKLAWYTDDNSEIEAVRIKVRQPKDLPAVSRDGMSYVSKSFMLKATVLIPNEDERRKQRYLIGSGKIKRFNARLLVPAGKVALAPNGCLVKGDMIVRPDKFMDGYDIIVVPENIKKEIRPTDNFMMFTASEHHPVHEATWDIQRLVMNPQIMTHAHRFRDLETYVTKIMEAVHSGELPEWMLVGNEAHTEEGIGEEREAYKGESNAILRWQKAGLDIRSAQNMLRMAMGGSVNRMAKWFNGGYYGGEAKGYAKAMYLPKSNATVMLIVSHGSLTKVGNYKTRHRGDMAWYAPGIGIVIPDDRFEEIYALLGGADFDDSVELQLCRIWSSDPTTTAMMAENGVISRNEMIPTSASEAKLVASALRSPNGVGEFSFLEIEDILDLPWQLQDLDNAEVIDLATLPLPQGEALKKVKVTPIQGSLTHSHSTWTRDDALRQILAQQWNPGIGGVANAIMAWAGVMGPSMPPSLTVPFEQLVDGAQQLSDPAIFNEIADAAQSTSLMALTMLKSRGQIDSYLVNRFSGKHKVVAAEYGVHGELAQFQEAYRNAIKEIWANVEMKTLQMRAQQPLVEWVKSLNFGKAMPWASEFYLRYTTKLSNVDGKYKGIIANSSGLKKITLQRSKHAEIRKVINDAVAELNGFDKPGQRALALWHYVLAPEKPNANGISTKPLGRYDRLVFQQGDGVSIMDMLIPVLHQRGWGVEVPEEHIPLIPQIEDPDEEVVIQVDEFEDDEFEELIRLAQSMDYD
jgi:hypothetical protein